MRSLPNLTPTRLLQVQQIQENLGRCLPFILLTAHDALLKTRNLLLSFKEESNSLLNLAHITHNFLLAFLTQGNLFTLLELLLFILTEVEHATVLLHIDAKLFQTRKFLLTFTLHC